MMEIVLGSFLLVLALIPGTKFYDGMFGRKQGLPPIEPSWIPRLLFVGIGLGVLIEGVRTVFHH